MGNFSTAPTPIVPTRQVDNADLQHQGHAASTQQPPAETFWQRTTRETLADPIALYTLILAVATTLLWLFTASLWWVTYKLSKDTKTNAAEQAEKMERAIAAAARSADAAAGQVDLAQSTAKQQLRAYVGVDSAGLRPREPTVVDDTNTHVSFVLKNFGQTPARILFVKLGVRVVHDEPIEYPYDKADKVGEDQVLNPGQIFVAGSDFHLSTDNYDRVCSDASKVVVFGQFGFEDEYEEPSVFNFRYGSSGRDFTNGDLRVESLKKQNPDVSE